MSTPIVKSIVKNPDGSLNVEKTKERYDAFCEEEYQRARDVVEKKLTADYHEAMEAFESNLEKHISLHERWDTLCSEYIPRQFDKYPSPYGTIVKPMLINISAQDMLSDKRIEYSEYNLATKMIGDYIDDNVGKLFAIVNGKNGGVKLL
jgi:hypothetical protein